MYHTRFLKRNRWIADIGMLLKNQKEICKITK